MVNISTLGDGVEPTFDEMCLAHQHAAGELLNQAEHRSGWQEIYDQSQAVLLAILEEARSNVVRGKTFTLKMTPKGLQILPRKVH